MPYKALIRQRLTRLASELESIGCRGLEKKLSEYPAGYLGKLENLEAELSLAKCLSEFLGVPAELLSGPLPDILFRTPRGLLYIEVEHKSSSAILSDLLNPDPAIFPSFRRSKKGWERAAYRLHKLQQRLNVDIQPYVGSAFQESVWSRTEREQKEKLCQKIIENLIEDLKNIPPNSTKKLCYPNVHFQISPAKYFPPLIKGQAPLEAHIVHTRPIPGIDKISLQEWLSHAIRRKNKKHRKIRKLTRQKTFYLVALVIDEAIAYDGHDLASVVFGPLESDKPNLYRRTPPKASRLIDRAHNNGWDRVLTAARFSTEKTTRNPLDIGIYFRPRESGHLDGILALNYLKKIQFLPNIFSKRKHSGLQQLFPHHLHFS